jgi:hypothetical protein
MSLTPELFRRLPLLGLLVVLPVLLVALVLPARGRGSSLERAVGFRLHHDERLHG